MTDERGLIVRGTARHDLVLPVTLRIDAEHGDMVRFGPRAGDRDGWVDADLMDIGLAGAGVLGQNFLPRGTRIRMRIQSLDRENPQVLLECSARVMRVIMTDRRPGYMLGLAFEGLAPSDTEQINKFIEQFAETGSEGSPKTRQEGAA